MSELLELQLTFSSLVPRVITYAATLGRRVKLLECLRTDEQSIINALREEGRAELVAYLEKDPRWHGLALAIANNGHGNGVIFSNHRLGLAIDFALFDAFGNYLTKDEDYLPIAEWWEKLHPLARAGIRWGDADHLSLEWQGRK